MTEVGEILLDPAEVSATQRSEAATIRAALRRNATLVRLLACAAELDLPGWYVAAGCVAQTVWNVHTGREPEHGIRDYDLIYFDSSDTGWAAENEVIQTVNRALVELPAPVEVRNQARVPLWYERRFGKPCPRYDSTEAAIDTFPTTATSIGVHGPPDGPWRCYAPFGLADLLALVVRPNTRLVPREVYEQKAARWQREWPELRVRPWT